MQYGKVAYMIRLRGEEKVAWCFRVTSRNDLTLDRLESPSPRASPSAFLFTSTDPVIFFLKLVQTRVC
jgi:hypothetical protein